jgi:NADPH:quinone reductase-like Zn-dependent oxidoreductase
MRAVVIDGTDLRVKTDLPMPTAGPHDLLVRVHAVGVNFADLMRKPSHFGEAHGGPPIAGLEFAGVVVEAGPRVRGFAAGDRVMAMDGSAYAEFAAVDHRLAARVPDGMAWPEAAAVTVSFTTAHDALYARRFGGDGAGAGLHVGGASQRRSSPAT